MKSKEIPQWEKDNLISYRRNEIITPFSLKSCHFDEQYIGHYRCTDTFRVMRKNHHSIQLLITISGAGHLHYRDKDYDLAPSTAMLINNKLPHEYSAKKGGWEFKYLHFSGAVSEALQRYTEQTLGPVFPLTGQIFCDTDERLEALLQMTEEDTAPDYAAISAQIYNILIAFHSGKNQIAHQQQSAHAIQRAAAYIRQNYNRPISTQDIADAVFLSRTYMSELFMQTYGISPHDYLISHRISIAKDMLLNTELSISEIAEQTGFRDVFALSRVFRQKQKLSPSEYRRKYKAL